MSPLLIAYLTIYGLAILLSLWVGGESRRFVASTHSIADTAVLERFKAMARRNMRFALLQMAVLVVGLAVGLLLVRREGMFTLVAVLVANGILFALGRYHGRFEKAARCLPAATPELQEQHQRISKTWVSRPLPDF